MISELFSVSAISHCCPPSIFIQVCIFKCEASEATKVFLFLWIYLWLSHSCVRTEHWLLAVHAAGNKLYNPRKASLGLCLWASSRV